MIQQTKFRHPPLSDIYIYDMPDTHYISGLQTSETSCTSNILHTMQNLQHNNGMKEVQIELLNQRTCVLIPFLKIMHARS